MPLLLTSLGNAEQKKEHQDKQYEGQKWTGAHKRTLPNDPAIDSATQTVQSFVLDTQIAKLERRSHR